MARRPASAAELIIRSRRLNRGFTLDTFISFGTSLQQAWLADSIAAIREAGRASSQCRTDLEFLFSAGAVDCILNSWCASRCWPRAPKETARLSAAGARASLSTPD